MKHTTKQSGRSRNKALAQRAAQLGCGISLLAVSAMLAARPARAQIDPASVVITDIPANSSSAGFVTSGSQQTNIAATVDASVNNATGSSLIDHTGTGSLPSTESVTGNELAAFATGSGQTNTVNLANIGTGGGITGIAVLAEQQNTFSSTPVYDEFFEGYDYTPDNIDSSVTESNLENETTNPANSDSLTNSSNLIEAQTTGNVADSSVNGVVPLNYASAQAGSVTIGSGGTVSGNVVVGSSQTNVAIDAGSGSTAGVGDDTISLDAYVANEYPQSVALSTAESGNAISSVFLGNSAINDIGVDLTSGSSSGGPTFSGALALANQQAGYRGAYGFEPHNEISGTGNFAYVQYSQIVTNIEGTLTGSATLLDGAEVEDNNVISATATGNSALGTAGGPGNEISLGVNLAGATELGGAGNTIDAEGTIISGGDLVLGNAQYQGGSRIGAYISHSDFNAYAQNLAGSSINMTNNAMTASAIANNASNAIETPAGAGINLISGLTALTSDQTNAAGAYAETSYGGVGAYAGDGVGTLSITNSTVNLTGTKITTTAEGNQVTNNIALSASTVDAGALGAAIGPAGALGSLPGPDLVYAGISLNNLQSSPAPVEAAQYSTGAYAYLQGNTISNSSAIVNNSLFTSEATGNNATNSVAANGAQGVSGSIGLLNSQAQSGNVSAYLEEGDDDALGTEAIIALQSLGGAQGISGVTAQLTGTESYAEATDNNASNTLDAMGGTLSNAAAPVPALGLSAELGTAYDVAAMAGSDLALANEQDDFNLPAYADNFGSQNYIVADSTNGTISGSSFTIGGPANSAPTSQAVAIGNEAINALSALASTLLTDTAGLVNAQANSIGAQAILKSDYVGVALNPDYTDDYAFNYGEDGGNISDTSVTVGTGAAGGSNANILRALAYGNQASNVLSASAGTVSPDDAAPAFVVQGSNIQADAPFDSGFINSIQYGVGAAYSLLSDQSAAGTIAAGAEYDYLGINIGNTITNPALTDVTANVAGNAVVASAFGNQASNSATVAVNNLEADSYSYYPAADVTNLQTNESTLSASLGVTSGYPMLSTELYGDGAVVDSTLGVNNNTVLAQAEGNSATNSLNTTGGNIADDEGDLYAGLNSATFGDADNADPLAFSEQNVQYTGGAITVNQGATDALVATGGAVDASTLTADTNAFEATGYGNNATSSLDFGGTSNPVNLLDTAAGLQNVQYTEGALDVTLGVPGTAAVAAGLPTDIGAVPYTVQAGIDSAYLSENGESLTVTGAHPLVFNVESLTPTELEAFESLFTAETGYTVYSTEDKTYTLYQGTYLVSDTDLFGFTGSDLYNEHGSAETGQDTTEDDIPGTPAVAAVPPSPSVLITVAGSIASSTLDVSNNTFNATAVANNAVNSQNIAATSVWDGGDLAGPSVGYVNENQASAYGGYLLANDQSTDDIITATAYGEAGINPDNTSTITSSALTASGNTQMVKAEADIASNTLTLAANNTTGTDPTNSATLVLLSNQSSDGNVSATAGSIGDTDTYGLVVTAPGAMTGSTLTMDGNSSEALAVENNATNLLSADATNLADAIDGYGANASLVFSSGDDAQGGTSADYVLLNEQTVSADNVAATDVMQVVNSDSSSSTTNGLIGSTANISGNTTSAFAQANAASNTLDLTAANSAASGALTNGQGSEATVNATGFADVGFNLTGGALDGPPAAASSAINVSDNSTTVQGIGNQATNALNADTGASYGQQVGADTEDGGTRAVATYAVLNNQDNAGAVSATGAAFYGSALNGGGSLSPVAATTVTVSYNTVDVKAFGNSANNSATVSALNSGNASVALENTQTNTGAITATGDGSQIGSTIGLPGASGVSVAVGNNSVIASAIGNVATNAITTH